jgi:hypothetical protein
MDLKIFEDVFALRDEAMKDQLWTPTIDPKELARIAEGADTAEVLNAKQEDLAASLIKRALALSEAADFSGDQAAEESLAFAAALLDAAVAPLDWAVESPDHAGGPVAVPLAGAERAPARGAPARKTARAKQSTKPAKRAKRGKRAKRAKRGKKRSE